MDSLQGSFTLIFKQQIPDQAKAIPQAQINEKELSVFVSYASVTPRRESVELLINGESYSFAQTISKVINSNGDTIFSN